MNKYSLRLLKLPLQSIYRLAYNERGAGHRRAAVQVGANLRHSLSRSAGKEQNTPLQTPMHHKKLSTISNAFYRPRGCLLKAHRDEAFFGGEVDARLDVLHERLSLPNKRKYGCRKGGGWGAVSLQIKK